MNKSMGRFIFILGGVRSGKSRYALELAKRLSKKVLYIATCTGVSLDSEMKKRIALHKKTRPKYWKTIEVGGDINSLLAKLNDRYKVIIIDCMGLLVSNLLEQGLTDKKIHDTFKDMSKIISRSKCTTALCSKFSTVHKGVRGRLSPTIGGCSANKVSAEGGLAPIAEVRCDSPKLITQRTTIVVSNEVGSGIVPDNYLARRFRDSLGLANQIMAGCADKVIFMQSGIPVIIKGDL